MKTKYPYLMFAVAFMLSLAGNAQTLNQNANWPNTSWTVTGTYSSDAGAFESDPTTTANFAFDDDDAGSGSDDSIAAESPVIDLTAIHAAGEIWLTITVDYVYNYLSSDVLEFQYWDADEAVWTSWEDISLPETDSPPIDDFCSGTSSTYTTATLNIAGFTSTQLSGFQYRIFYDDDPAGSDWNYGFCFDSPTIVSQTPPTCPAPSVLTAINVTAISADLGWTESGSATQWEIEYGSMGFALGSGTVVSDTDGATGETITGLTSGTDYEFYVTAICGGTDISTPTGPFSFTTPPGCGDTFYDTGGVSDNYSNSEDYSVTIYPDQPGSFVTLDFTMVDVELCCDDLAVYNGVGTTGTALEPDLESPASFTSTDYPSGALTVTFSSDFSLNYTGWEADISCSVPASCLYPAALTVTSMTQTSADLGWTEIGTAPAWNIEYGPAGFTPGTGTMVSVTTNPYPLTGLTQGTSYDFYVQADCGGGDLSPWAGPKAFQTEFDCSVISLSITSTTDDVVPCFGSATLQAVASGNGTDIFWYDAATDGNIVATGPTFNTPQLTVGTSYWVAEVTLKDNGDLACTSPRVQVDVTISTSGDVTVATLPYTTTANTASYGDPYEGASGSGCGSDQNYLNGNDVVYTYTSAEDDVLQITLSDLTDFYGGVFIYDSCENIGANCLAGAVAGPSDNDFGIDEFHTTAGETYYIVISSWLTPSIGYTLDIKGFDCATFEAPLANGDQNFVSGDTLADLDAETTMSNTTIVWYDAATGGTLLPNTTSLVDGTTYYVAQKFVDCVSALVPVTVHEIECGSLEVLSTTGDEVSCRGAMTLEAVGSGTGNEIYWYDAPTGGNVVGTGASFTTPVLTTTASYWAAEVVVEDANGGGSGSLSYCIPSFTIGCGSSDEISDFTLTAPGGAKIIEHLGSGCSPSSYGDFTNITGNLLPGVTYDFEVTTTYSSDYIKIWIDLDQNGSFADPGELLFTSSEGSDMITGSITIPSTASTGATVMRIRNADFSPPTDACSSDSWGEVHDYTAIIGAVACESPRVEVVASVVMEGDVNIDTLPYTVTSNTTLYGNNFSGVPGSGCGTSGDYLAGNDVVYLYNPTEDDILDIHFEDLTDNGTAGLFIYNSCGQIGVECIDGITEGDEPFFEIQDFPVTGGMSYFFVISTANGDPIGYTFEINGFDCTNNSAPTGESEQFYTSGDTVSDLEVEGNLYNEGYIWYSDPEGTTVIPDTTSLEDGATYYVSQTVLGCESGLLAITVHEFDCSILEVVSTTNGYICNEGTTILTAEGGSGNKIYWYDAATDGNLVGMGTEFETPSLSTTTSYYASEVFVNGSTTSSGYGMTTWSYGSSSYPYNDRGLVFTAEVPFKLVSVDIYSASTGELQIFLIDAGSGDELASATVELPGGSDFNPELVTVPLDFEIPEAGEYHLVAGGTSGSPYLYMMYEYQWPNAGYPFDIGAGGSLGQITTSIDGQYTYDTEYSFFYNWAVEVGEVQCGSERVEAMAIINSEVTAAPTGSAEQSLCEGQTLADIVLETGGELVWYNAAEDGVFLPSTTVVENGMTYYAAQIVEACESADRFAVTVAVGSISSLPEAAVNQPFVLGETIADLEVEGTGLAWYADEEGTTSIPISTALVDQTTYYVSQTVTGNCESGLLPITAHEVLNVEGATMADVYYYPNPIKGVLNVGNSSMIDAIEIYNLLGQKVIVEKPHALQTSIDVSGLQSGTYLMRVVVISEGKAGMFKLIKE